MKFQERLYSYLRDNEVPFTIQHLIPVTHPLAFADRKSDYRTTLVRTEFAFVGNQLTMLALPAAGAVDVDRLRQALHRPDVTLVDSIRLDGAFPDVEIESIPPIGVFWQLAVIMDSEMCTNKLTTFCAGTKQDLVTLHRSDFERLTRPAVMDFAVANEAAIALAV